MGKIIILTPEDTIKNIEYTSFDDVSKAVNGNFEMFSSNTMPLDDDNLLEIDFFVNNNHLSDDYKKVNALATALTGCVCYGNVAILIADNEDNRGFNDAEYDFATKKIQDISDMAKDKMTDIHEKYDDKPSFSVFKIPTENTIQKGKVYYFNIDNENILDEPQSIKVMVTKIEINRNKKYIYAKGNNKDFIFDLDDFNTGNVTTKPRYNVSNKKEFINDCVKLD